MSVSSTPEMETQGGDSGLVAYALAGQALDGMLAAGVLDTEDRDTAATGTWAPCTGCRCFS
jgi:hypothetical protein